MNDAKDPDYFSGQYSFAELVKRAVYAAQPHAPGLHPRWVAIMDTFQWGSTTSVEICRQYGLDPHEMLEGRKCDTCHP